MDCCLRAFLLRYSIAALFTEPYAIDYTIVVADEPCKANGKVRRRPGCYLSCPELHDQLALRQTTGSFSMYGDDDVSAQAVIIDPVLDFDVMAGATSAKCRPSAGFPCA
jgi:hypothetical protein